MAAGAVRDRVRAFMLVAQMKGLPMEPSVVVPLSAWREHASLRGLPGQASGAPLLTTVRTTWRPHRCLGACRAHRPRECLKVPNAGGLAPVLSVTKGDDRRWASEMFDAAFAASSATSAAASSDRAIVLFKGS